LLAKTLTPQGFSTFKSHKQLSLDSGFMMLTRTYLLVVLPPRTLLLVVLFYGPTCP